MQNTTHLNSSRAPVRPPMKPDLKWSTRRQLPLTRPAPMGLTRDELRRIVAEQLG